MSTQQQASQMDLFDDMPKQGEYLLPEASPDSCKSCGAAIVWAKTPKDRWIPLAISTIREVQGQKYAMTHYADCPHGKDWQRR